MIPRLCALKQEGFLPQEVTTGVMITATNTNGVVGGEWWAGYWDNRDFYPNLLSIVNCMFSKYFIVDILHNIFLT